MSDACTTAPERMLRLRLVLLQSSKCRRPDTPRMSFPVPVRVNRFAAPLCVFCFGMVFILPARRTRVLGESVHM